MKIFRTIVAFFQALLPLVVFGVISVVIYSRLSPPFNRIVSIAILIVGIFASRSIFNMMRRRGVISVMSGGNASYDLDELEPTQDSGVLKLIPEELANLFSTKKIALKRGVTISIWGDWEGRKLDVRHQIENVEFNSERNLLTLSFSNDCSLKIKDPNLIFSSDSYLKIAKAREVVWQVPNKNDYYRFSYLNTGKTIKTQSNTDWKPHKYDIGIGMNAVYLQG